MKDKMKKYMYGWIYICVHIYVCVTYMRYIHIYIRTFMYMDLYGVPEERSKQKKEKEIFEEIIVNKFLQLTKDKPHNQNK